MPALQYSQVQTPGIGVTMRLMGTAWQSLSLPASQHRNLPLRTLHLPSLLPPLLIFCPTSKNVNHHQILSKGRWKLVI
ncbi:hypothetical protein AOXY_G8413 [Acipenser oxyrinchus oxyrinchus]|uniref:Uncharacterized protein n=1 Tax=Acipenser oxyrinchus oxyrinchus TaxID=40147 RepID=A0AAD8DHQ5_ACIOX|nr:hypothetical protein AOXY_G8413 [Acipenser oxyrinchus oxyrinchus]